LDQPDLTFQTFDLGHDNKITQSKKNNEVNS
jgi:hypothetical protein